MANRMFRFLSGGKPAPLRLIKPVVKAEPTNVRENNLERQVRDLLFRYELAEEAKMRLREEHPEVFDMMDRLNEEQEEAKNLLKRLLHTKDGPPDVVKPGASSHVWARGNSHFVEVTYKKKSNYYDPKKLPLAVFSLPGVVTEVDRGVLDQLAKKDGRIARALTLGDYMTPAVSIPRLVRDLPMQSDMPDE